MLYAFGFERVGVVVGDLYFVDPNPGKGQECPEHGGRVELRVLGRCGLKGSVYSARPIGAGAPIWLADLDAMLATGGFPADTAGPDDAEACAAPEMVDATGRLLEKMRSGELGGPSRGESPAGDGSAVDGGPALVRTGWLLGRGREVP